MEKAEGFGLLRKEEAEKKSNVEEERQSLEIKNALDAHKQEVAKKILGNSIIFNARALNEKKKKEKKIFEHFVTSSHD
jgi:hypothetical protein